MTLSRKLLPALAVLALLVLPAGPTADGDAAVREARELRAKKVRACTTDLDCAVRIGPEPGGR